MSLRLSITMASQKDMSVSRQEDPIHSITQAIPKKTLPSPVSTPQVFAPPSTPSMPLIPSRLPPPMAIVRIKEDIVGYSD